MHATPITHIIDRCSDYVPDEIRFLPNFRTAPNNLFERRVVIDDLSALYCFVGHAETFIDYRAVAAPGVTPTRTSNLRQGL